MKKTLLLLLYSLGFASGGLAQHLSPSVVATDGGFARTQTMTLEWTLGESVVETHRAADRLYTQGFHQPVLQVTEQPARLGSEVVQEFTVAPNPVTSHLTITPSSPQPTPLQLRLTDLRGHQHVLPDLPMSAESIQVDMTRFPAGTYLLHISKDTSTRLKSYKVVKTQ